MMMIFGMTVFMRQTLPYQTLDNNKEYRWVAASRTGVRPAQQFLGVGEETITLNGELRPEITGGKLSLLVLETMANTGRAWPLLSGNGVPYGMFVITSVKATHTDFLSNGDARKITFTLTLKRVDETLVALFGDLKQQAEAVIGKAGEQASQLMEPLS
ncbi:phage tail protein [Erwinia persicina]|uniref:phage tail protein n=1 Tax=Erwinia persicina TaxID=55211 RepID=UPI001654B19F|nr:phage tail protein [Erwinia persicina]MBC3944606.1 phage tail protein [Erwinia persicina]